MKPIFIYLSAVLMLAAAATGCSGSTPDSGTVAGSQDIANPQVSSAVTQRAASVQSAADSQSSGTEEPGRVIRPLPLTVDIANPGDCTLGASVEPDGIFLDDSGRAQITITLYDYDQYDSVDIASLAPGDVIEYRGTDLLVNAVQRDGAGLVSINGGEELGGFDLLTDDNTVYYECGFNGIKTWLALGTVTLPVNEEFFFVDDTDVEKDADVWYLGDFLTPGTQLPDGITPYNTTVRIENGQVMDLFRIFVP